MTRNSGFALVLALVVTTMAAIAALELTRESRLASSLTSNFEDLTRARLAAFDGLEMARKVLIEDDPEIDGITDNWTKEIKGNINAKSNYSVKITDTCGLINLSNFNQTEQNDQTGQNNQVGQNNQAKQNIQQEMESLIGRIFLYLEKTIEDAAPLLDWIDEDSEIRTGGAEKGDYSEYGSDAGPRNGTPLDIRELKLIRGIDDDLLYGNDYRVGLLNMVTVFGQEKINLNTAPESVLSVIIEGIERGIIEEILQLREDNIVLDEESLKGLDGMTDTIFNKLMSVSNFQSSRFKIISTGKSGKAEYTISIIVERKDNQITVLAGGV